MRASPACSVFRMNSCDCSKGKCCKHEQVKTRLPVVCQTCNANAFASLSETNAFASLSESNTAIRGANGQCFEALTGMHRPVLSFIQSMQPTLPDVLEECLQQASEQQGAGPHDGHVAAYLRLARAVLSALQLFPPLRAALHRRPLYRMLQHQVRPQPPS